MGEVKVKIQVVLTDKDLNLRPIGPLPLVLHRTDSGEGEQITLKTGLDGRAEVQVPPGRYRLLTPQGVVFQGRRYTWELDLALSKPEETAKLTNDNAKVSEATNPFSPEGRLADVEAVMQGLELSQDQASAAEKMLASSPDDLNAHLKLIGYYGGCGRPCPSNTADKWAKHIFWLIDHHPESSAFGFALLPPIHLFFGNRGWSPSPELVNEYRKHWEQGVAAHPGDSAVLSHAASALYDLDPNLGLSLARKVVELDPTCKHAPLEISRPNPMCRQTLGNMYGLAIVRISGRDGRTCLPKAPDAEEIVSTLRREIESSTDPEVLVSAALTIRSHNLGSQRCGGNADDAVQFGMKLVRKAVGLDPSLIDRLKLRDMLNSSR